MEESPQWVTSGPGAAEDFSSAPPPNPVIAGLDPVILTLNPDADRKVVDTRVKPAHDEGWPK